MKKSLIWIEPSVATCVDLRTGILANRKRCAYPRVGPTLLAMLQDGALQNVLQANQVDHSRLSCCDHVEWHTTIIDCLAEGFHEEENFLLDFSNYTGPVNYYGGMRYGLSVDALERRLSQLPRPDVIAIPCSFTSQEIEVIRIASILRHLWDGIPIVLGGHFASDQPKRLISSGVVTAVCVGESWISFPLVVDAIARDLPLHDIQGIAYQNNNETKENDHATNCYPRIKNIDSTPIPDWSKLAFSPYDAIGLDHMERFSIDDRIAPLDTEFGCGLKPACRFCSAGTYNNGFVAFKSAQRLMIEIRILSEQYGRNFFYFDNDNPLAGGTNLLDFFGMLIEYNQERTSRGEREIRFALTNGAASWSLCNEKLLKAAFRAGLKHIAIGLESASHSMIAMVGKPSDTPKYVSRAVKAVRKTEHELEDFMPSSGIPIEIFVQVGLPMETEHDLAITADYCSRLSRDYSVSISPLFFCPIHGAPLRETFLEENPKAATLPNLVMGLMGTEKKDDQLKNELAAKYFNVFRNMRNLVHRF